MPDVPSLGAYEPGVAARIVVVGAGSLGSAIGGVLAIGGHEVTMITRNVDHVAAIRANGLRLDAGTSTTTVDLTARSDYVGMAPADLVIVLVKSFDTTAAITDAGAVIGPETTVLTLQNGVGCEQMIADVVGDDRVIAGRTFVGGRLTEPGVVEYGIVGRRTTIGELDGQRTARIVAIAEMFRAAGLDTEISDDVQAMMWEKLFVNVSTGGWSAVTGLPYGELSTHPDVAAMAIATVAEAMKVARAIGVAVTTTDPAVPWRRAWEGLPYEFRASMLQSLDKGSRTEVDVIHGAVCRAGRQAGVPTPINDTLLAAVKGLERGIVHGPPGSDS